MNAEHVVPPSKIQSTLDDLWNANENKNKIRASLFNLVFFSTKSPREEYLRKVAYNTLEKFPARVFFLSSDPTLPDSLKTAVSVVSTKQGEFDITCDLIEIDTSGKEEDKIPFLLLPHLIPDLPIFLVWPEDPSKNDKLFEELKGFATRIIFDSEASENLTLFADSILTKKQNNHFEIADLNWARFESWRSLINSTLSTPTIIEKLQKTSAITITYNAEETPFFCHTKIQAIYLQAWIASRLKWKAVPQKEGNSTFTYEAPEGPLQVQLKEIKSNKLPPGMIVSLEIETTEGESFAFSRKEDAPDRISFKHSTPTECSLMSHIEVSKRESGQSLVKEICHKGTSEHYIEALQTILKGTLPC